MLFVFKMATSAGLKEHLPGRLSMLSTCNSVKLKLFGHFIDFLLKCELLKLQIIFLIIINYSLH